MRSTKPTTTACTRTLDAATAPLAAAHQGRPGPLAPATQAVTAAQRQRAYRQRSKLAVTEAIGDEDQASRVTLLALLGRSLAALDDETAKRRHAPARNSARRVMNTLVTRYGIQLQGQDRT